MHQSTDTRRLFAAAQRDSKLPILCVRAIRDFCLMARYRSHTRQTMGYMNDYLGPFHSCLHIFGEFRASKGDRQEAARAVEELREGQGRQSTINQYFKLTSTQQAKRSLEEQQERQQVVDDILQQATFNFPKMHLLSHYGSQITDFGTLL